MNKFVNCALVLTSSSVLERFYDDDDFSGLYTNPQAVANNIRKASFVGWTVPLLTVPATGDFISLQPFKEALLKEWKDKMFLNDPAITYLIGLVKQEPRLGMFWCDPKGERRSDEEVAEKILFGIPYDEQPHDESPYRNTSAHREWTVAEGLCEGRLVVTDEKYYIPWYNKVVIGVKHEL